MRNKNILALTLILLLGLLLAACSGAATPAPEQPAAEAPAATEEPAAEAPAATEEASAAEPAATEEAVAEAAECAEPVTIEYWHITTDQTHQAVLNEAIAAFEKDNPCAKVNVTVLENEAFKAKMTTVMQSGEPPDVFQSWGGGVMNEYVKAGLLRDITADLDKDGWRDTYAAGPLAVYSFEGKNYGVPRDQGMVGFWYNKELFEKAGIEAPPTTWAELLEDVQKLKDAGITPISLGEGDKWPGHFWWVYLAIRMGGKEAFDAAYSRQGSFADEPFVQAGEKLQELIALEPFQDGYLGLTYNDQATLMGNGEAAMELMGQWAPAVEKDQSANKEGIADKLGWFPFPMVEGGQGDPADALGGGNGWTIGKDAPDEAVTFLKYLTTKEQQCAETKVGFTVPVVEGTAECIEDPLLKTVAENAAKAPYLQLYYDQALPPAVGSVVNDAVQELFAGTKSPEEVAQTIEDSAAMELTGAPAAEAPAATEEAAAAAADCAEPVTIEFWHINTQDDRKGVIQQAVDAFMKDNPCVQVNQTILENEAFKAKMTTVMQSDDPPDVFSTWGGGVMNEYAKAGLLRDITQDIQQDGFADTFGAGPLAVYSFEGKQYGVASDQGMVGFWYNKELFEKAGIEAPPTTWTELLDDVQKLKDAGITPISLGEGDKWPGHFWWVYLAIRMGGKEAFDAAYSRQGSFADEPFVQAGEKLQELIALEPFQDGYLGLTYNDQARAVGNGEAAMELMGQWAPGVQKDESADKQGIGDKLGWFPFPMVEGGQGDPADALGGGGGWLVGRDAPDEAVTFLKYLSSKEFQCGATEINWILPVVKGTEECITDPLMKTIAENAAKAPYLQLYYDQALPPAVGSVVNDAVQELFAETKTPEEVGQTIEDSAAMELDQ